jgi:multiple sugar transport system permease protein/raffinose/stachyose/melibiose transport system permease protein
MVQILVNIRKALLLCLAVLCAVLTGGPFLWVAALSLRTTPEILREPYGLSRHFHWGKFVEAWMSDDYGVYFGNSVLVVASAVVVVVLIAAMSAHCLARYRFRGGRGVRFLLLSGLLLPPQMLILSLFQMMFQYRLYNSLVGLTLVYIATQLPMNIFILEGFFAQIPQDLFDAARLDGYSDLEAFWRIAIPIGMPAILTTATLTFVILWNEFLYAVVLLTDNSKRTLPLGIMHFMGGHQIDIGMIATGLMIAVLPVVMLYAFFSEAMIKGMTAGAVR